MSLPQIARDDETPCVSPQRPALSSRVLPFPSRAVTMSDEDRLRALAHIDPDGHASIMRAARALYILRFDQHEADAAQR